MATHRICELYEDNLETLRLVLHSLDDLTKIKGLFACEIRVKVDDVDSWAVIGFGEAGDPCILRFEDDFEPILTPSKWNPDVPQTWKPGGGFIYTDPKDPFKFTTINECGPETLGT